ncbi:MAG: hypothetical protein C4331_02865 [Meiothermus sp.]
MQINLEVAYLGSHLRSQISLLYHLYIILLDEFLDRVFVQLDSPSVRFATVPKIVRLESFTQFFECVSQLNKWIRLWLPKLHL